MKYQIPAETLPNRFAKYAVNPLSPMLVAILGGALPGILWLVTNAYLLGCRDADKQMKVGLFGLVFITGFAVVLKYFRNIGFFKETFGDHELLSYFLIRNIVSISILLLGAWLTFRQNEMAAYRKEANLPINSGIVPLAILVAFNFLFIRRIVGDVPYLYQIWGM